METLPTYKTSLRLFFVFCALLLACFVSCRKSPTDGVSLIVNTNIIKYSANITVRDANDNKVVPSNVQISISGNDADNVYEISGKKDFTVHNGSVQIGINPALVPKRGSPVSFNLEISADGYLPLTQEVQMAEGQLSQNLNIVMLNINAPPPGISLVQQDVDATTGALAVDESVKIGDGQAPFSAGPPQQKVNGITTNAVLYSDNALATVVLPTGTSFYYMKNIKTGTATGTKKIPVYAKQDTTVYDTVKTKPNAAPITGTGISAFTPAPSTTVTARTYTPIVDYYSVEYTYNVYKTVKVAYRGKVKVICQYYKVADYPQYNYSYFSYWMFNVRSVQLLDKSYVSEDEMLYKNAAKVVVTGIYFTGSVNGKSMMISPNKDINGNTDKSITWRLSMILDPTTINPYTGVAIKQGDSVDVGIDYVTNKTIHAVVTKTGNQLRAENRTGSAGFYHKAKYVQLYSFLAGAGRQQDIPDPMNIHADAFIDFGGFGPVIDLDYYITNDSQSFFYDFKGKYISDISITVPTIRVTSYYFDMRVNSAVSSGAITTPYQGFLGLNPVTDFQLSLTCTGDPNKPITVHPTYNYYDYTGYDYTHGINYNFVNGDFKTRGFAPGYNINYNSYVGDTNISFSYTVKQGPNPISLSFGYKDNKICNTF